MQTKPSKIIDTWEKFKNAFPTVDWDKFVERIDISIIDGTFVEDIAIDYLQDKGIPFPMATSFVIAASKQ